MITLHDDGHIDTDNKPNRMSGTTLAGIVNRSKYDTPYTIACKLLNIYHEDISNKPAVKAGVLLEPVILEAIADQGVFSAEDIFAERIGDHEEWPSDFDVDGERNPYWAGHIDGMTTEGDIVEIKTALATEGWSNDPVTVPEHYHIQASFYAHMMEAPSIRFYLGVLTDKERTKPSKWRPEGNIYRFDIAPREDIAEMMEYAVTWYDQYINKGVTPKPNLNDPRDKAMYDIIKLTVGLDDEELSDLLSKIESLEQIVATVDESKAELKEKKEELKFFMNAQNLTEVTDGHLIAKISSIVKVKYDVEKAIIDGLDLAPYAREAIENRMTVKPVTEKTVKSTLEE